MTYLRIRLFHWSPPDRPLSNAEVELEQKFHLPVVNQVNIDFVATLLAASPHGEHSLAGMSLSFEGKVVLVTGAGGGKKKKKKKHARKNRSLARSSLLLTEGN